MWRWLYLQILHLLCYWGTVAVVRRDSRTQIGYCVKNVLMNQLLWGPLVVLMLGLPSFPTTSLVWFPFQFIGNAIIGDLLFYTVHRTLHVRGLYEKIHEQHHLYHNPKGCATFFAHPVEHMLANVFPALVGPLLTKCCFFAWCLWIGIITINTVLAHSGVLTDSRHELHHLHRRINYGNGLYLLDRLCGSHQRMKLT